MSGLSSFTGCMMGGALGDALGYPVEFMSYNQMIEEYGTEGIKEPPLTGKNIAKISHNTQMTLFTAEGLLWALKVQKKYDYSSVVAKCFCSYQRWLHTQSYPLASKDYHWMIEDERLELDSPLLKAEELYHQRSPEATCVEVLLEASDQRYGTIESPINRKKGSGAAVRVAPIGLAYHKSPKRAFEAGCDVAAITHTHPTAYYSAGAYSAMTAFLINGKTVEEAANESLLLLEHCPDAEEVTTAVGQALTQAKTFEPSADRIRQFGVGVGLPATLAIGVYCAISYEQDYKRAVRLAVNQDGDSASAASICGSLLGARLGITGLEPDWIKQIEAKDLILKMASLLYSSYE